MESDARSTRVLSGGGNASSGAEDPYSSSSTFTGKRKAEMTAEERASYERERNRVHARNTRARKKQYMEELKERVENMHAQKAAVERQKEDAEKEEEAQIKRWESTVTTIMQLRCEGVTDEAKWMEVLAENFRFTLPLTPYRAYDPSEIVGHRRVLLGIEGMISDVTSLTAMCVNMAKKCRAKAGDSFKPTTNPEEDAEPRVHLKCFLGTGDFLFSGPEGVMCMLSMRTTDARRYGSALEVEASGMLRACFAEDGKLEEMDVMFDGVAVHQQMQKAVGCNPSKRATCVAATASAGSLQAHNMAPPPSLVEQVKGMENVPPTDSATAVAPSTAPTPIAEGAGTAGGAAPISAGTEDGGIGGDAGKPETEAAAAAVAAVAAAVVE